MRLPRRLLILDALCSRECILLGNIMCYHYITTIAFFWPMTFHPSVFNHHFFDLVDFSKMKQQKKHYWKIDNIWENDPFSIRILSEKVNVVFAMQKWYLLQLYFARKKVKKHYRKWVHFLAFALHKSNIALKENWNKSSIHLLHYFFTFAHYTPWANIWKHPLHWLKNVFCKFYYKSTSFLCSKK